MKQWAPEWEPLALCRHTGTTPKRALRSDQAYLISDLNMLSCKWQKQRLIYLFVYSTKKYILLHIYHLMHFGVLNSHAFMDNSIQKLSDQQCFNKWQYYTEHQFTMCLKWPVKREKGPVVVRWGYLGSCTLIHQHVRLQGIGQWCISYLLQVNRRSHH